MAQNTIFPQGTVEVTVPAAQSIAISNYGGGIAKIYYLIEDANRPDAYQFQQSLNDSSVTLGAFSVATVVKIEAGNSKVFYDVAVSPDTGVGDADTLNGKASDTGDTADTIAARDGSGDLTANAFESTVATGTAPLTVASTTVVTNLNADTVDGIGGSNIAKLDSENTFTENQIIQNSVVGGVAPDTNEDDLIIENLNGGITITSSNTGTGTIAFGDSDAKRRARISYNHTSDELIVRGNGGIPAITITADDFDLRPVSAAGNLTVTEANVILDNNKGYQVEESGGTNRTLLTLDGSNVAKIGNVNNATDILSNGTLTYNGASLATGSIDTTAAQTITVVDGLITSIV